MRAPVARALPIHLALVAGALAVGLAACSDSSSGGAPTASTAAGSTAATGPTPVTGATAPAPALPAQRTKTAQVIARHGEGFLEVDHGGVLVLHTKGTAYERGFQYGILVGDRVESVFRALDAYAKAEGASLAAALLPLITTAGTFMYEQYFDADALEELRGIVDGNRARNPNTTIRKEELVFINSLIDVGATVGMNVFQCSSIAAWGPLTEGGKAFQTRNVDLMVGSGLEDHVLIVMAKPEGGVPYVNAGWAGMIGSASGLNAHGIGVGQVWAFSRDKGLGRPWPIAMREILATGQSVEDGVAVFRNDSRTYGSNFVLADRGDTRGGQPKAVALESTKNHLAVFGDDDPKEDRALWNGQPYGIRIANAVFRGDVALDPTIRSLQTASNGPDGDPRTSSAYRNRYKGQADELMRFVNAGVKIGAQQMIELSRNVAMRNNSLQCVVYANSDLELWVANARLDNGQKLMANNEPFHHYSLDYYTPTAVVTPATAAVTRGASLTVQVDLETLGRERGLTLAAHLEVGGATIPLAADTLRLGERGTASLPWTLTVPASAPAGAGRLVVEVFEHGTADLVDLTIVDLTVAP